MYARAPLSTLAHTSCSLYNVRIVFRTRKMVDSAVLVRGPPTNQPIKRRSIEKPRPLRSDPDLVCLGEILKLIDEVEVSLKNIEARNDIRTRIKVYCQIFL